ncbi:MAG: galactonate dehydratase [Candidatus Limnocylindrales bacterium]
MRITRLGTTVVGAGRRNWIFVRVETDQPGLVGWGEASLELKTRGVLGAIEDVAPLVVGEDPRRVEHLWQVLYRQQFFRGGPVEMSALSGIDQALWDIKGKDLGVPVWQLLGGNVREKVRFYDHLGGGAPEATYGEMEPAVVAELAERSVADGFDALKVLAVPRTRALDTDARVRSAAAAMAAVREAVGPDVQVMVDLHGRTSAAMAIRYGQALAEYDPWFFEEPVPPEDVDGYVTVARALPGIPVAGGERLVGRWAFRPFFERGALAVAQPDVCHAGGISECRRIAAMAEAHGLAVAPHNPLGPVATMANLHLAAATPNHLVQEVMRSDVPWRDEVVRGLPRIIDGYMDLPQAPGLGVEVDEGAAARHPYEPEPQYRWFHEDGAVAEW